MRTDAVTLDAVGRGAPAAKSVLRLFSRKSAPRRHNCPRLGKLGGACW